jgi:hypothetical protein
VSWGEGGRGSYESGDGFWRRWVHPALTAGRNLDGRAFGNGRGAARGIAGGIADSLAGIDGERPAGGDPHAIPCAGGLPLVRGAAEIALLQGHLVEKTRNPSRGWFRGGDFMQRLTEPFTVFLAMKGATKLAVPKQPKRSDYFAAIQAAHNTAYPAH